MTFSCDMYSVTFIFKLTTYFQIQILNLNQPIIYVILLYFKLAPIKVIKLAFFWCPINSLIFWIQWA